MRHAKQQHNQQAKQKKQMIVTVMGKPGSGRTDVTASPAPALSTYERRKAALVKARAARAANRAASGKPVAVKPAKPAAAQPADSAAAASAVSTAPAFPPYVISPGWRITATSDGRNWLLQRQRGDSATIGAVASEDDESEDLPNGDEAVGAPVTWADAGFYVTVEGACRAWATRYARGVMAGTYQPPQGATDLPAVLAHALTRLEAACAEIGRATGKL